MLTGKFLSIDTESLTTMLVEWRACLSAIAVSHQSYSIAGRSFTRAQLAEVSDMVAELAYALSVNSGTRQRMTYADLSNG